MDHSGDYNGTPKNGMKQVDNSELSEQSRLLNFFGTKPFQFPENQDLFVEGEPTKGVYYLLKGALKLQMTTRTGSQFTYDIAQPYEFLGFYDLLNSEATYTISARTLTPVSVGFLEKAAYFQLIREKPGLTYLVLRQLHRQIKQMERKMRVLRQESAENRILLLMQSLVNEYGIDAQFYLNLALTTDDLADLTGISKTYMKKLLPGFRSENLFETRKNHIRIIDPEYLRWIPANQGHIN